MSLRAVRTPEQITEQLQARMRELEEQASQAPLVDCLNCRFHSNVGDDGFHWHGKDMISKYGTCINALVKGFDRYGPRASSTPALCGPERALWQPQPLGLRIWRATPTAVKAIFAGVAIGAAPFLLVYLIYLLVSL